MVTSEKWRRNLVKSASTRGGWTEFKDPSSGKTFYHNESTGESRWTKPDRNAVATPVSSFVQKQWEKKRRNSIKTGEDGPWTQYTDPNTGRIFFHNHETGESKWYTSTSVGVKTSGRETTSNTWTKHVDPDSGAVFWHNAETQERVWDEETDADRSPNSAKGVNSVDLEKLKQENQNLRNYVKEFERAAKRYRVQLRSSTKLKAKVKSLRDENEMLRKELVEERRRSHSAEVSLLFGSDMDYAAYRGWY